MPFMTDITAEEAASAAADLHRKMDAEIAKLIAETSRINNENRAWPWFPLLTATIGNAGLIGAAVALVIAFRR